MRGARIFGTVDGSFEIRQTHSPVERLGVEHPIIYGVFLHARWLGMGLFVHQYVSNLRDIAVVFTPMFGGNDPM